MALPVLFEARLGNNDQTDRIQGVNGGLDLEPDDDKNPGQSDSDHHAARLTYQEKTGTVMIGFYHNAAMTAGGLAENYRGVGKFIFATPIVRKMFGQFLADCSNTSHYPFLVVPKRERRLNIFAEIFPVR